MSAEGGGGGGSSAAAGDDGTQQPPCPALNRAILRTDAVVFWNTRPILGSHNLYRFGQTSNITTILVPGASSSSDAAVRGYVLGILGVPLFMLALFGAWLLLVLAFRVGGPRRFGFLSGGRVVLPSRPLPASDSSVKRRRRGTGAATDDDESRSRALPSAQRERPPDDDDDGQEEGEEESSQKPPRTAQNDEELAQPLNLTEDRGEDEPPSPTPSAKGSEPLLEPRPSPLPARSGDGGGGGDDDDDPNPRKQQLRDWSKVVRRRRLRLARIRIAVLLSGVVIVAMAALLLVYGVQNLSESVGASLAGIDAAIALCDSALVLIGSYAAFRNETVSVAERAVIATNATVCPQVEAAVCAAAGEGGQCTDFLHQVIEALQQNTVVLDSVMSVKSDVARIQGILSSARSTIVSFNWAFWIAAAAVALLAACTLVLMGGVAGAWRNDSRREQGNSANAPAAIGAGAGRSRCDRWAPRVRGWVVVPVFVFLLVVGWVFSMVFVVGSVASADFCYDSPDQNVLVILESMKGDFSSALYPLLVYYVSGCPRVDVVEDQVLPLARATLKFVAQTNDLLANLTAASPEIAAVCGTDPSAVRVVLSELSSLLCLSANTALDTIDFFTCANWNGLYASVMYTSICYNGNTGLGWVAATISVILLCSLIFLTLRAAFYELVDEAELKPPPKRFGGCHRWFASWCCCCCHHGGGTLRGSCRGTSPGVESAESVLAEEEGPQKPNDAMGSPALPLSSVADAPIIGKEDDSAIYIRWRSLLTGNLS